MNHKVPHKRTVFSSSLKVCVRETSLAAARDLAGDVVIEAPHVGLCELYLQEMVNVEAHGDGVAIMMRDTRRFLLAGDASLAEKVRQALRIAKAVLPASATPSDLTPALLSAGEYKTCPECAETVKAAAKICRFCRHEFDQLFSDD